MATLNQSNASRINGAKSKGPVTAEGKARVSQNGLKHGIYSQLIVLRNEDHAAYEASREAHLAEWTPSTETEYNLVIDIIDARWRLRRLSTFETCAIDFEVERMRPEVEQVFTTIDESTRATLAFNSLIVSNRTYEVIQASIRTQHRIIDRATSQLLRLGKLRRDLEKQEAPAAPPAPEPVENLRTKPEPRQPEPEPAPEPLVTPTQTTKNHPQWRQLPDSEAA